MLTAKGRTGTIELTNTSIKITRGGWLNLSTGNKTIPISSIKAVEFKEAGNLGKAGYIRFVCLGSGDLRRDGALKFFDSVMAASLDENSVLFGKNQQPEFSIIKNQIEQFILQNSSLQSNSFSIADEIIKLNDLRQTGVLTESEFIKQKQRLLNN